MRMRTVDKVFWGNVMIAERQGMRRMIAQNIVEPLMKKNNHENKKKKVLRWCFMQ